MKSIFGVNNNNNNNNNNNKNLALKCFNEIQMDNCFFNFFLPGFNFFFIWVQAKKQTKILCKLKCQAKLEWFLENILTV